VPKRRLAKKSRKMPPVRKSAPQIETNISRARRKRLR
jgi:hypothetical protein